MWTNRIRPLALALLIGATLSALPVKVVIVPSSRLDSTLPDRLIGRELDAMAATDERVVATSAAAMRDIVLADKPTRVVLGGPRPPAGSLTSLLQNLAPGRRLHLVLKGLSALEPPGVIYHLYLDLPPGTTPAEDDPHYVGTFNYFGFVPPPDAERDAAAASVTAFSFDVTEGARTLQRRGLIHDPVSVTIVPAGTPAPGARPVIGEIALVEQ